MARSYLLAIRFTNREKAYGPMKAALTMVLNVRRGVESQVWAM